MDHKMNDFCHIGFTLDNFYELVVTLTSVDLKVILECQFKQYLGKHSGLHTINEEASFYGIISLQDNNDMEHHIYADYTFDNFQWF